MKPWTAVALVAVALVIPGLTVAAVLADLTAEEQQGLAAALGAQWVTLALGAVVMVLAVGALGWWAWRQDRRRDRATATGIDIIIRANPGHRLPADSETARAVNELATAHQGAESRLADRLAASEAETRLERDSLLAVLAGLEVPVGLVDEHGRIMLVNPSARTVLGPGRHIAAGRSIFSVFDAGDFAPLLAQALSGVSVTAQVDDVELRLVRITGEGTDPTVLLVGSDPGPVEPGLPAVGLSSDLRRLRPAPTGRSSWSRTPLDEVTFTVVDCETTGLHADAGDQLVSVGAVRVAGGRVRSEDTFDELVNPGRAIPPSSTEFHGIGDSMVVGAPPPAAVASALAGFAEDSVLVGHHLRFDLGFLLPAAAQGDAAVLGEQTLDTMLLSAVVFDDGDSSHSLDSLSQRLGVSIVGRHSALGDALGTAEVLVRMIPLLAARGIHTLGEAQEASAATALARRIDSQIPRPSGGSPGRGADR